MIGIAFLISCFFKNGKKAIISGLVIFFLLYMFFILKDVFEDASEGIKTFLTISPLGGISLLFKNILIVEDE